MSIVAAKNKNNNSSIEKERHALLDRRAVYSIMIGENILPLYLYVDKRLKKYFMDAQKEGRTRTHGDVSRKSLISCSHALMIL